jgi:putative aldouronate transport system permease protein
MRSKPFKIDYFIILLNGVFILLSITFLYPIYFQFIASFSNPAKVAATPFLVFPVDPGIGVYRLLLNYAIVWVGYRNSLFYLILSLIFSVSTTLMGAFALSRKRLAGRKIVLFFIIMTMFINGGMIPTFLVVKSLGLYNKIWSLIFPSMIGVWNLLISRTYIASNIPDELYEAAIIDGSGEVRFFTQILLPLSKALIAVLILYYGSSRWNAFFDALIYLRDRNLYPLQLILREILIQDRIAMEMGGDIGSSEFFWKEGIKYGVTVVSIAPLLMLFPFVQRYFVKGVMIGSLKE